MEKLTSEESGFAKKEKQEGKQLPTWLYDESSAELADDASSSKSMKTRSRQLPAAASADPRDVPGMFSRILSELQRQSSRLENVHTAVTRKQMYCTSFDILTMTNVMVDAVCEETVSHVRSTVDYTDLVATVTVSFVSAEVSILLDETDCSADFVGVSFLAECVSDCHLLADAGSYRILLDMDTERVTDLTQLTLTARCAEATRELYQALSALSQRGVVSSAPDSPLRSLRSRAGNSAAPTTALDRRGSSPALDASLSRLKLATRGGVGRAPSPTMRPREKLGHAQENVTGVQDGQARQ